MPDSSYKYFVQHNDERIEMHPLGVHKIEWGKEDGDFRHGYKEELTGDITFVGQEFQWFYAIERSKDRCYYILLDIHKKCGGVYAPWKQARLSFNAGQWDIDQCKVTFKADTLDKYSCLSDFKDDYNILILPKSTTNFFSGVVETTQCIVVNDAPTSCPVGDYWTLYWIQTEYKPNGNTIATKVYARYKLSDGSYKPAIIYDPIKVGFDAGGSNHIVTKYKVMGKDNSGLIDNGVKLKDVFEAMLYYACFDLQLQSNFFQWNPTEATDINYVTGQKSMVTNLVIFQKSDVKRPNASNNATKGNIKWDDLLNNICTIFNLEWDVIDGKFIIEHVSWWNANQGLDLTQTKYDRYTRHKLKYKYNRDDMPRYEKFSFMEASNKDFISTPISYSGACLTGQKSNETKEYNADLITTDIDFVMNNPADDSKLVSDDGFVLIACDENDTVITLPGILDVSAPNNSLSWAYLFQNYFLHNRVLLNGRMNGEETTFLTTKKTKVQDTISIPLCCDDTFDPTDVITTALGADGELQKATFHMSAQMLELEIAFGLEPKEEDGRPIANNDFASTEGSAVNIRVLDNDIYVSALSVIITAAPQHGVAVVNPDRTISYTPDVDFLGSDVFYYKFKDSKGLFSNIATVSITVQQGSGCLGHNPTLSVANVDGDAVFTGISFAGSEIKVFSSTDGVNYTDLGAILGRTFTAAMLASGINLGNYEAFSGVYVKVKSEDDYCNYGYSNVVFYEVTCMGNAPIITQAELTDNLFIKGIADRSTEIVISGSNTETGDYEIISAPYTRTQFAAGIILAKAQIGAYTWFRAEGKNGDCDYGASEPVEVVPDLDENPIYFIEADDIKEILWTPARKAKYGLPVFQVWVYGVDGKPELTTVALDADLPYPDTTKYIFHNFGAAGYIIIK